MKKLKRIEMGTYILKSKKKPLNLQDVPFVMKAKIFDVTDKAIYLQNLDNQWKGRMTIDDFNSEYEIIEKLEYNN